MYLPSCDGPWFQATAARQFERGFTINVEAQQRASVDACAGTYRSDPRSGLKFMDRITDMFLPTIKHWPFLLIAPANREQCKILL